MHLLSEDVRLLQDASKQGQSEEKSDEKYGNVYTYSP